MTTPQSIRFQNLLAAANDAAHYRDEERASTLLCEAMLILNSSILANKKAPVVAGA